MNPVLPVAHHVCPQDLSNADSPSLQVMPQPLPQGVYWGDNAWFQNNQFCWFKDNFFKSKTWQFGKDRVKLTNKILERVSIKPDHPNHVGQASAVYDAQFLKENGTTETHAIVKIFMRIPNIPIKAGKSYVDKSDLASNALPITENLSRNTCTQYLREYQMLDYFTQENCSSTPKVIANFQGDEDNPWVRRGFLRFVVMTKVPGRKVSDFWSLDPVTPEQRDEQRRIQQEFKRALVEVSRLKVVLTDPGTRNIIWYKAKSKCYLIDFENSMYDESVNFTNWADLGAHLSHPDEILKEWGLVMRERPEK